jgi:hypothetical protein
VCHLRPMAYAFLAGPATNPRRVVASVASDSKYPQMWRVRLPNGHLTDMVNLTRAKDAARSLALKTLIMGRVGASPMRSFGEAADHGAVTNPGPRMVSVLSSTNGCIGFLRSAGLKASPLTMPMVSRSACLMRKERRPRR